MLLPPITTPRQAIPVSPRGAVSLDERAAMAVRIAVDKGRARRAKAGGESASARGGGAGFGAMSIKDELEKLRAENLTLRATVKRLSTALKRARHEGDGVYRSAAGW